MTALLTEPVPARAKPPVSPNAPRVFLFGMPDAGKSALLGALARAAETQERLLAGRIDELGDGLRELQRQVYADQMQLTREAVVAYPLHVDPFIRNQVDATASFDVVLIDCDGRAASDLAHQANKAGAFADTGPLAQEIRRADAMILVVDSSSPDDRVAADFAQFAKFLRLLRHSRGWQTDVAAFPVLLVIAKCDRLARPGDTASVWVERIEARKEQVADQFKEFLDREDAALFGGLAFQSLATAVRRPALANLPAKPDEPLGVGELFRDVFVAAREFRVRRNKARIRLRSTMFGLAGLVVALGLFAVVLGLTRNWRVASPLAAGVDAYRSREGTPPAGHLDEPVPDRIEELVGIAADPLFGQLSSDDRDFVTGRLDELREYQEFRNRLRTIPLPRDARDMDELDQIETHLREQARIPEDRKAAWTPSEAGRQRARLIAEVAAIHHAVEHACTVLDQSRQVMERHYYFAGRAANAPKIDWREWSVKSNRLLAESAEPLVRANEMIQVEGNPTPPLTFATVLVYPEVRKANERWAVTKAKLMQLRDIVQSLGMAGPDGELKVPATFAMDHAPSWWSALKQRYPQCESWRFADLPDAAVADVRAAAAAEYQKFLVPARAAIAAAYAKAPGGVETPAKWLLAAQNVAATNTVQPWTEVAKVYRRLISDENPDPFAAFSEFFSREKYTIDVLTLRLTIPDVLAATKLTPTSPWVLGVQDINGQVTNYRYRLEGTVSRDAAAKTTTYSFVAAGPTRFDYHPGDTLWAEVDVNDEAGKQFQLTWWGPGVRSRLFQFDRLHLTPRLHLKNQKSDEGDDATGVKLELRPASALPQLPDLLPEK